MPITADLTRDGASERARRSPRSAFEFVPHELAQKARGLVEGYHALHGYACLPDMLWQCGARDLIESNRELRALFRRAVKQRTAREANNSFVHIATTICALEILARDLGGWGARSASAKRAAERTVAAYLAAPQVSLLDGYLYPRHHIHLAPIDRSGVCR
jgi:hypothetical protein